MTDQPSSTPPLPTSIWALAWVSLASQVLSLVERGVKAENEVSLVGSILLGALLVGWVSAGVVRARTFRLVLAWVVLALSGIAELLGLLMPEDAESAVWAGLGFGTTVASLVALDRFRRTAWFRWQRTKPPTGQGASITGLVAVGVLVGVLGGIVVPTDDGARLDINATGQR